MEKYLIALDLDGTLLKDWQTISDETIKYLKELKEEGHTIVLATGRPFRSSEKFYDQLDLDTPLINYNGGYVTSKNDPDFVPFSLTVEKEKVIDVFTKNKEFIHNAFGEIKDDIYLLREEEEIKPLLHLFNGARLFVGDFKDTLKSDTNGFIIIANKGDGQYIESYINETYPGEILCRNWGNEYKYIIEMFTADTNKGNALEYVANYLGFKRENIIAIGDAHNDIEMLKYAGHGVAMANAQDSLLEVADEINQYTNLENGVAKYLKDFFENKKAM